MHDRVDEVINISGHRMSTEIEQSVLSYPEIFDAASVSIPDEITGEVIVVFVVLKNKHQNIQQEISNHLSEKIGKVAKPKYVYQISNLPKTKTGKIMRRLLKSKLLGEDIGDLSSLENPDVLDEINTL